MPNCDYYASTDDHMEILNWLFSEESCDVYENASEEEQPLKQFWSAEEVLSQFDRYYEAEQTNQEAECRRSRK